MRASIAFAVVAVGVLFSAEARAYRPFDGTDADVAETGAFELEFGASSVKDPGGKPDLGVPAYVLNFGLVHDVELVVDGRNTLTFDPRTKLRLGGDDVQLKWIVREGSLQGKTGLSVAIEAGPLFPSLPAVDGERRFGALGNVIVSYLWPSLVAHLNNTASYARTDQAEVLPSLILEIPSEGARPVAELVYDHVFGVGSRTIYSLLLGCIARASDSVDVDFATRVAAVDGHPELELRLGFTWTTPMWTVKRSGPESF